MTYDELATIEPRLAALPQIAADAGHKSEGDTAHWYHEVKRRLSILVGDGRNPPTFKMRRVPNPVEICHPDLIWNIVERSRCIGLEPEHMIPLYSSEAYDTVYQHLLKIYEDAQDAANQKEEPHEHQH